MNLTLFYTLGLGLLIVPFKGSLSVLSIAESEGFIKESVSRPDLVDFVVAKKQ